MSGDATRLVELFRNNMEKIQIGATLAHKNTLWVVKHLKFFDGSVRVTLVHDQRKRSVLIPICITGPCLSWLDLEFVKPAPSQRTLSL
ncbi:MAG: hypothetical protein U1D69_03010 [Polynucleobacter sp.]|nr:hypothetical protein [Polynucleobacter sp.]